MSQSKVAPAAANFAANPSLDDPHVSNISKDDEGEKFDRALGADVLMLRSAREVASAFPMDVKPRHQMIVAFLFLAGITVHYYVTQISKMCPLDVQEVGCRAVTVIWGLKFLVCLSLLGIVMTRTQASWIVSSWGHIAVGAIWSLEAICDFVCIAVASDAMGIKDGKFMEKPVVLALGTSFTYFMGCTRVRRHHAVPIGIGVLVLRYVSMAFYMGTQANRMDVSVDLVDVFLSVLVSAFVFLLCLLVVRPEWEVMSWGVMFVAIGWLPGSRQSRPAKKGKVESISSISTLVTRLKLLKLFTFAFMLVNLIITGGPVMAGEPIPAVIPILSSLVIYALLRVSALAQSNLNERMLRCTGLLNMHEPSMVRSGEPAPSKPNVAAQDSIRNRPKTPRIVMGGETDSESEERSAKSSYSKRARSRDGLRGPSALLSSRRLGVSMADPSSEGSGVSLSSVSDGELSGPEGAPAEPNNAASDKFGRLHEVRSKSRVLEGVIRVEDSTQAGGSGADSQAGGARESMDGKTGGKDASGDGGPKVAGKKKRIVGPLEGVSSRKVVLDAFEQAWDAKMGPEEGMGATRNVRSAAEDAELTRRSVGDHATGGGVAEDAEVTRRSVGAADDSGGSVR